MINIYVCDDGNRPEIKHLAENYGVHYINRSNNKNAKEGNLNHTLTVTTDEFILTQDADMIPKINILKQILGYFSDRYTAMVQAPQTFYNKEIFQHNLCLNYEVNNIQDFFMRVIQESKDRFNATLYLWSNAVFRRKAIEKIGGFTTGVITEDMATGLVLQNDGWKTIFVNESLASGLSSGTLSDHIKQRDRWGIRNIQVKKIPFEIIKKFKLFLKIILY